MHVPKTAMRDVLILIPGITGSVLVDEDGNEIWNATAAAAWSYISTLGKSLEKLVVPVHPPGTDAPQGGLRATGLVQGIHGVFGLGRIDGYKALASMIRENFDVVSVEDAPRGAANLFEFSYDWRLSNRTSAKVLKNLIDDRLPIWQHSIKGGMMPESSLSPTAWEDSWLVTISKSWRAGSIVALL
jgi:hypothetical protein